MRARSPLVIALLLVALSAGCVGPEGGSDPLAVATVGGAGVDLAIEVVDVGLAPVAGAQLTLLAGREPRAAETDGTGLAIFRDVAPGEATLDVRAAGFAPRRLSLVVPDGGELRETVTLVPLGDGAPVVVVQEFHGFFECSATALIVTGDCFATARALAHEAGVSPPANATNERFQFPFEVGRGWSLIRVTQTWAEPAASLGGMMRVNLEPYAINGTEAHSERYARAEGGSPIVLELRPGPADPTASAQQMVAPAEGGLLRTRSFHLGLEETHNAGGTTFLGAGAAVQQEFTVVIEVHYPWPNVANEQV